MRPYSAASVLKRLHDPKTNIKGYCGGKAKAIMCYASALRGPDAYCGIFKRTFTALIRGTHYGIGTALESFGRLLTHNGNGRIIDQLTRGIKDYKDSDMEHYFDHIESGVRVLRHLGYITEEEMMAIFNALWTVKRCGCRHRVRLTEEDKQCLTNFLKVMRKALLDESGCYKRSFWHKGD